MLLAASLQRALTLPPYILSEDGADRLDDADLALRRTEDVAEEPS